MIRSSTRRVVSFMELCRITGREKEFRELFYISHFGNQLFTNDSFYEYILGSVNGEPLSELEELMVEHCGDSIQDDSILFEVKW